MASWRRSTCFATSTCRPKADIGSDSASLRTHSAQHRQRHPRSHAHRCRCVPLEHKPFDLERLLLEVVDEARARADSLGLQLRAQVEGRLPNSFIGDPARIKQILTNLVSNALKFTTTGGVRMQARCDGRMCTVDIIDSGPKECRRVSGTRSSIPSSRPSPTCPDASAGLAWVCRSAGVSPRQWAATWSS